MKFVFDVPSPAAADPHGFAVLVKVKDRRFIGLDRPLGRTEIHLRNLKRNKIFIFLFLPNKRRNDTFTEWIIR